jgi:hypothetical protein
VLSAVLSDGLAAVAAACAEALTDGVHSADVVLNILSRHRDPGPVATILTPDALRLRHAGADFPAQAHPCPTAKHNLNDAAAIRPPRPIAIGGDLDGHARWRARSILSSSQRPSRSRHPVRDRESHCHRLAPTALTSPCA